MKYDPSRTLTLRKKFQQKLSARFKILQKEINELLIKRDVFGLTRKTIVLTGNVASDVPAKAWSFLSDERKMEEFEAWLAEETGLVIAPQGDVWQEYIEEGYRKGAGRAFDQYYKTESKDGNEAMTLRGRKLQAMGLNAPESKEKVKLLAKRLFTDLQGVTDVMAVQIRKEMLDGLVQGDNPRTIGRRIAARTGQSVKHAQRIARTVIIRAHAEGQLDALERLGVEQVGVMVEWSTAGDDRVCPLCEPLNGQVFKIKEAHGMIPLHPNCRCAFMPALP